MPRKFLWSRVAGAAACAAAVALIAPAADALKYAPVEHHLKADPALPQWHPAPVESVPEEEVSVVGADVMDEITLGWIKLYRKAYPRLSVTMEAKSSGSGAPGLISGKAELAPVGREMLPAEHKAFVDKFGYEPTAIKVATGSVGSLGKTATSDHPRRQGQPHPGIVARAARRHLLHHAQARPRGRLDVGRPRADRRVEGPPDPLVRAEVAQRHRAVLQDGRDARRRLQERTSSSSKGSGFTHAFTVAAEDMATHPGGLTYALLANVTPNVSVVPLSMNDGGPYVMPTVENVYSHEYPLSRYVYIYINRPPGTAIAPKVKEFLKLVLSRDGQDVVANEGVYIPLTPQTVQQELKKLD